MDIYKLIRMLSLFIGLAVCISGAAAVQQTGKQNLIIRDFVPEHGLCRVGRETVITAVIENKGDSSLTVQVNLLVPDGISILRPGANSTISLGDMELRRLSWVVKARDPKDYTFVLNATSSGSVISTQSLNIKFLPAETVRKLAYIPDPEPVKTSILVGAHNCPLWESNKTQIWAQVRKHPERTPALGFYSQENPEVADWETKWAVEHGVSFFVYCWYRAGQGGPVKMHHGSAIEALFKSRFVNRMKFTIMWENQSIGTAGVSDEKDLMDNLLPFWIDNYFKYPSYLKIDNKPVLFIYRPENLIHDLGSVENVVKAFNLMRKACVDAGFSGLYILGEYRGLDMDHLRLMKQLGLDYTFAYCWPIPNNPTPDKAVDTQMRYIKQTQAMGVIPQVVTLSQAWSGWADEGSIWKIPPAQFEGLLKQAKDFIATFPANELGSKMLLLDNWNEWSEGHYIAPYREYGFGYLDAVRKVFSDAPEKHTDLIPEDIGMGPYDLAYTTTVRRLEDLHQSEIRKVVKKGADEKGLVAWWAFDEKENSPVTLDYSGHRLGGVLYKAARTKGIDGDALKCNGGCVFISSNDKLSPVKEITLACWVYTGKADQNDKWIINRIYSGGGNTGYRMGLYDGKPAFQIPLTEWSHCLRASEKLPVDRWTYLTGTFDGKTMRIYIDGKECGSMDRPGPINPNNFDLCLGSFAEDHNACFTGLLDEVKLYDRALSADEIRTHAIFRRRNK